MNTLCTGCGRFHRDPSDRGDPIQVSVCCDCFNTSPSKPSASKPVDSKTTERINHPAHYGGDTPYEAIKVIEAWGLGFCLGNTVKYIARSPHKGTELEDLKKAAWYLARRIAQLEAAADNITLAQAALEHHAEKHGAD
jgi:hypothetical protein